MSRKGFIIVGIRPRHILVLRLSAWGDIVQCSGAIHYLLQSGHRVTLCTKIAFADFVRQFLPGVQVLVFDNAKGEAAAKAAILNYMSDAEVDFLLDLHDTLRTKLLRWSIPKSVPCLVARKPRLREFLIFIFRLRSFFGLGRGGRARHFLNTARRLQEYMAQVDGGEAKLEAAHISRMEVHSKSPRTHLDAPAIDPLRERLQLPEKYFVIAPGGAWFGKRWPGKRFQEIAAFIAQSKNIPVIVLGAAEDEGCVEIAAAAAALQPGSRSLAGELGMSESAIVAAHAEGIVGNDTGLVHVAEACGVPTVMIEGPTHKSLGYTTYRASSLVVEADLFCRPCSKNGRICWRFGTRACMDDVSVGDVELAIRELPSGARSDNL